MRRFICVLIALTLMCSAAWAQSAPKPGNYFDVLLIGENKALGDAAQQRPHGYADALVVLSLNMDTGRVKLINVEKRLPCDIPDAGNATLGDANAVGGPQMQLRVLNELYQLDIPYYAMIDMAGLGQIIDAMGGVTLDVPEEEVDGLPIRQAGTHVLNGAQVVAYLDAREEGTSGRNHLRIVLDAVARKLSGIGMFDAFGLGMQLFGMVETNADFFETLGAGLSVLHNGFHGFEQLSTPGSWTEAADAHAAFDMDAEATRVKTFLYGIEEENT